MSVRPTPTTSPLSPMMSAPPTLLFERKEKAPSFKPMPSGPRSLPTAGRPLAKLSVVCRNPKHEIDDKAADAIVNQALPSFVPPHLIPWPSSHLISSWTQRLAASTLSTKGRVPPDITIALAGIQYLTVDNPAVSSEWVFFPFPPSEIIPAYPLDKSPTARCDYYCGFSHQGSDQQRPSSKQDRPAPQKPASDVAAILLQEMLRLLNPPPPRNISPNPSESPFSFYHGLVSSPSRLPKSPAVINDESSEDEEPPSKVEEMGAGPSTSSVSGRLRSSNKSETTAPKPKKGLGSVDEQIESMIPEIREKLREMMPNLSSPGYIRHNETCNTLTLTLSAFQGHRRMFPTTTFGPAPPPKDKNEPPKEPFVELVRFSAIEYEQVLQPPAHVLLCLMYGNHMQSNGVWPACTHCNQKKTHTLCDHTWRADKVREVMGGIEEIRGIMFPDAPIVANMIPHLIDQVSTARELYSSLRNDLTDALRAFFS
ncbi:hypothetical protein B0H14DRAFT_3443259, partial [Mycena olivaceomarginata]